MKKSNLEVRIKGMTCEYYATGLEKSLSMEGILEKNVSVDEKSTSGNGGYKHLVIIGGGSAAFAAAIHASEAGARVTLINDGLPIGGTCVNVGCVPSKTLIRAAEAHHKSEHHGFVGIDGSSKVTDFKAVIAQKRALVEDLRQAKYVDVVKDNPNVRIVEGRGRLTSPNTVLVNGEEITATKIVIATGVRPSIPDVPGLTESGFLTNETLFELDELPESLIVLGGRYVALESAQMFARLGSKVTILQRSARILPDESADITEALTGYLQEEGIEVVTGVDLQRVARQGDTVTVEAAVKNEGRTFRAAHLLAATGRTPNTRDLGLEAVGVELDENGFLKVDANLRSSVPGIFGAGDVTGKHQFVYTAAYEGKLAAGNALSDAMQSADYTALPWVVFTDPQVAGVGLDEKQAESQGIEADVALLPLSYVPRALAARDTRGFIKLIRDGKSDRLIGARILAPEGSELLMEAAMAIKFGITVEELTSMFHPYLTLSEGIKLVAIAFDKSLADLSCCAS